MLFKNPVYSNHVYNHRSCLVNHVSLLKSRINTFFIGFFILGIGIHTVIFEFDVISKCSKSLVWKRNILCFLVIFLKNLYFAKSFRFCEEFLLSQKDLFFWGENFYFLQKVFVFAKESRYVFNRENNRIVFLTQII
jgi:hypothetical protein